MIIESSVTTVLSEMWSVWNTEKWWMENKQSWGTRVPVWIQEGGGGYFTARGKNEWKGSERISVTELY